MPGAGAPAAARVVVVKRRLEPMPADASDPPSAAETPHYHGHRTRLRERSSAAVCFTNRAKRFTAAQPLPCYLALRAMACSADTNGEQFASGVKFYANAGEP